MKNDIIMEIVSIERELNAKIEEERKKADEWLEEYKMEIYKLKESFIIELENEMKEYENTVGKDAERMASEIIKEAEEIADMLKKRTDDESLKHIILKYIKQILP